MKSPRQAKRATKKTPSQPHPHPHVKATGAAKMPGRESAEARAARAQKITAQLAIDYADATCALIHNSPFELIVATILSAQCTDARVNMVTPELFRRWPSPAALAGAPQAELEKVIQSTGFFRAKATNLLGMARGLVERHGGEVPAEMDALVKLPGVGRKTANVVLGTAFGIAVGVVVDTHVSRITRRLGLTRQSTPEKIEADLMKLLPQDAWVDFSHRLIHHGRRVCDARKPKCDTCTLAPWCPQNGVGRK